MAILSFVTTATTSKIASFLNALCGPSGDNGQSAACLVVPEQSREHETAAVTSSAQVKIFLQSRKSIIKFKMLAHAMEILTLQFLNATLEATLAQVTTLPERNSTYGMLESTPALTMPPIWDTLTL